MCRNITELRGLEPPATDDEIAAAALQYIRKVTGIRQPNATVTPAVQQVAAVTAELLGGLPPRRQPPTKVPPMRLPPVRERMGLPPLQQ